MPIRLSQEEVVTIRVLAEKGQNHCEIGRTLGVSEGTVRYRLRKAEAGSGDGRADKPFAAEGLSEAIRLWMEERQDLKRAVNVRELYEHLVEELEYASSYRSVLRYVRRHFPRPRMRTWRRVETPAGAQSQTDWGEYPAVDLGEGPQALSAFVMVLSHSRKPAVVWSPGHDQLCWLHCHNESYRRLAGVAAVNRIDNVRTALLRGAGAWGTIHPVYRAYARAVGFHIDACGPRHAEAKGKVEAKVRLSRLITDPQGRRWQGLEELQAWTDERIERWSMRSRCPATGLSVWESWKRELERLAPLPILPEPFDVAVNRPVRRDCMVSFEDRQYPVPFAYAGRLVEVRGCAGRVQILADGRIIREYPRRTAERILIDPSCWEGAATERVIPPPPLGRMGRSLQEIYRMPVERRPVDLYAALAEVAR